MQTRTQGRRRRVGVQAISVVAALTLVVTACGSSKSSSTPTTAGGPTTAASSSGSGPATGSPVKIGDVEDITGGDSSNGGGSHAGVLTAVKLINAAGGINGHVLDVTTYDAASEPTQAEAVIREAESAGPAAITGYIGSAESSAAGGIISAGDIPWVSGDYQTSETNSLPFWFMDSPTGAGVAAGAVNGLKSLLGGSLTGKKIAFEGIISPAVDANLAAIKSAVEADGGTVGPIIRDPLVITSWASQAANVMAAKPDAVIINHTEPMSALVAKALGVAGFTGPIITTEGASSDTMLSSVNQPNFYAVRETTEPLPGSALYQAAIAAGQSPTNIATTDFDKGFAAVYVIADTLKACGTPCSTSKFDSTLKGLGSITIPDHAMAGPLDFTNGQSGLTAAQVWTWDPTTNMSVAKGPILNISS